MKDFFSIYLPPIISILTIVGLSIAYFIKRKFDLKTKKVELSFSFFQQKKLEAIKEFFDSYSKTQIMWFSFRIYEFIDGRMKADKADETIWPHLNGMKKSIEELNLYMSEEELKPFIKIKDLMFEIQSFLLSIFNRPQGQGDNFVYKYNLARESSEKQCEELLKTISDTFKKSFAQ